jgi:hypothetical protein
MTSMLGQWLDRVERFMAARAFPVPHQIVIPWKKLICGIWGAGRGIADVLCVAWCRGR